MNESKAYEEFKNSKCFNCICCNQQRIARANAGQLINDDGEIEVFCYKEYREIKPVLECKQL